MNPSTDLTIATTLTAGYVRFLRDWALSIGAVRPRPAAVVILGNGLGRAGRHACRQALVHAATEGTRGIFVDQRACGLGRARNQAVGQAQTPWVMHLDVDDTLLPDALTQIARRAGGADVVQMGYQLWRPNYDYGSPRIVLYSALDGKAALSAPRIASGCSPFRRTLWEQWRYAEELHASWDYSAWIGWSYLGARFRPTPRAAFRYRQWPRSHWQMVGKHRHDDLLALRRACEADFPAAQAENLRRAG